MRCCMIWRPGQVFILLLLVLGCERNLEITRSTDDVLLEPNVEFEPGFVPAVEKCHWFDDKTAAYTVSFDDARATHYQVSGPILKQRNICGTFFINTREIVDWSGWQQLADMGHEIGSHSYSHPKMTELTEAQQRTELERAISDIRTHLRGSPPVYSFCYPYGLFNDQLRRVVMDYHITARGGGEVNPNNLSDFELTLVHGTGVYPPFDMAMIAGWVDKAIAKKAWINVYFHAVSAKGDSNETTMPVRYFIEHLDYVERVREKLWIATQGEVAHYIRLHREAKVRVETLDQIGFKISLYNLPDNIPETTQLTFKMTTPVPWRKHKIIQRNLNKNGYQLVKCDGDTAYFNIGKSDIITIEAKKSLAQ